MKISKQLLTGTRKPYRPVSVTPDVDLHEGRIRIAFHNNGGVQILDMTHNEAVELVRDLVLYLKEDREDV